MPSWAADEVAKGVIAMGEPISLVQQSAGFWDTATQTQHLGTATTIQTYGITRMMLRGIDGVTVKAGDLEVWLGKSLLDAEGAVPVNGDQLILGSSKLIILDFTTNNVMGYYHIRARGVE